MSRAIGRGWAGGLACGMALALATAPWPGAAAETPGFRPLTPVLRTLANGLEVAVFRDRRLPIVQIQMVVAGGSAQELAGEAGIANLTASLLTHGTTSRSAAEFTATVEALGGTVAGAASREYATVSGAFLSRDFDAGLELVADAVLHPIFPREDVEQTRRLVANDLIQSRGQPARVADEHFWAVAMSGHPYGNPLAGSIETVPGFHRAQLQAFHRDTYRPDRARLAIAGDVDPEPTLALVESQFGAWSGHARTPPKPPTPQAPRDMRIRLVDRPGATRAEIRMGGLGPPRQGSDFYALSIADHLLGSGPDARLRAAGARSSLAFQRDAGLISLAASVPIDSTMPAIERIRSEVRRFVAEPPSDSAVAAARRIVRGAFALNYETLGGVLAQWMTARLFDLPPDYLERYPERMDAVSIADVSASVTRWLNLEHSVLVVVGAASNLQPRLETLGTVEVVPVTATPVAVALAPSAAATPPTAEQLERGRKLAELAVAAHGGISRLRGIKDSSVESDLRVTSEGSQMTGTLRQVRKEPLQCMVASVMGRFSTAQVLNGATAWSRITAARDTIVDEDSIGVAQLVAEFHADPHHLLLAAAARDARVAFRGRETVGPKEADVLEVITAKGLRRVLFLDVESHRLVAMEDNPGARFPAGPTLRRVYGDYRTVEGILWPHTEDRILDGELAMSLKIKQVDFNSGVLNGMFERPATPAETHQTAPPRRR